jgi:hypothetical protein
MNLYSQDHCPEHVVYWSSRYDSAPIRFASLGEFYFSMALDGKKLETTGTSMSVALAYNPTRTALYHPERQETIFEARQSYSITQLAVEAARLAYYRAENSAIERARLVEALARVGFAEPTLFSDPGSGVAAFVAERADGTALLSFRGTQPDNYWTCPVSVDSLSS